VKDRRLPLGGVVERGPAVTVLLDGEPVTAYLGETVATVLFAQGAIATRTTVGGSPRGVFCGMGVCFECRAVVNGKAHCRSCQIVCEPGMDVRTDE